jgi:hypothetical protein
MLSEHVVTILAGNNLTIVMEFSRASVYHDVKCTIRTHGGDSVLEHRASWSDRTPTEFVWRRISAELALQLSERGWS